MKLRQLLAPARLSVAGAPHSVRTGASPGFAAAARAADRGRATAEQRSVPSFFSRNFAAAWGPVSAQRDPGRSCVELGNGARARPESKTASRFDDFLPGVQPHVEIHPVATAA
jgi:hypothetical protein